MAARWTRTVIAASSAPPRADARGSAPAAATSSHKYPDASRASADGTTVSAGDSTAAYAGGRHDLSGRAEAAVARAVAALPPGWGRFGSAKEVRLEIAAARVIVLREQTLRLCSDQTKALLEALDRWNGLARRGAENVPPPVGISIGGVCSMSARMRG